VRVAGKLETGTVTVNNVMPFYPTTPFRGFESEYFLLLWLVSRSLERWKWEWNELRLTRGYRQWNWPGEQQICAERALLNQVGYYKVSSSFGLFGREMY
jgi:hypothetical protein